MSWGAKVRKREVCGVLGRWGRAWRWARVVCRFERADQTIVWIDQWRVRREAVWRVGKWRGRGVGGGFDGESSALVMGGKGERISSSSPPSQNSSSPFA